MEERILAYCELLSSLINHNTPADEVNGLLEKATSMLTIDEVTIQDRVRIATYALKVSDEYDYVHDLQGTSN